MLITCPGAVALPGAPLVTRLRDGIPSRNLVGLYMMQEGALTEVISDQLTDSSGNGAHGAILPGYTMPIQRAHGLEVTGPYGMMAELPIPAGAARFTVLLAVRPVMVTSTANLYSTYYGATINGAYASAPSASKANYPYPVLNCPHQAGSIGVFDDISYSAQVFGYQRTTSAGSRLANQATVIGYSVDGPANTMRLADISSEAYTYTAASVGTYFDGTAKGNITIGAWRNANVAIVDPVFAELHAVAIYDRAMDHAEMADARTRLKNKIAARGITY